MLFGFEGGLTNGMAHEAPYLYITSVWNPSMLPESP